MVESVVMVKMADLAVGTTPMILRTVGLGSCVGVCLYDQKMKIAGMAHIMLPDSPNEVREAMVPKYAKSAIPYLVEKMCSTGADISRLTAKLAGGAHMFKRDSSPTFSLQIGERNVLMCEEMLNQYQIPIVSADTGGSSGRTITFYCETGRLLVRTVFQGERWI